MGAGNLIVRRIVLASTSPRRRELLRQIGLTFEVLPSSAPEEEVTPSDPVRGAVRAAEAKARDVAARLSGEALIIAADTVVVIDGMVLGKPVDEEDAKAMLRHLSGRVHEVITGFVVMDSATRRSRSGYERTRVHFRRLDEEEIAAYVASGEPRDKAGAYGIQKLGSLLVERIEGCYFNVVGLPLGSLFEVLKDFGVNPLLEGQGIEE